MDLGCKMENLMFLISGNLAEVRFHKGVLRFVICFVSFQLVFHDRVPC